MDDPSFLLNWLIGFYHGFAPFSTGERKYALLFPGREKISEENNLQFPVDISGKSG